MGGGADKEIEVTEGETFPKFGKKKARKPYFAPKPPSKTYYAPQPKKAYFGKARAKAKGRGYYFAELADGEVKEGDNSAEVPKEESELVEGGADTETEAATEGETFPKFGKKKARKPYFAPKPPSKTYYAPQ